MWKNAYFPRLPPGENVRRRVYGGELDISELPVSLLRVSSLRAPLKLDEWMAISERDSEWALPLFNTGRMAEGSTTWGNDLVRSKRCIAG